MKASQGRSWFASLRRDGKLFALVAGLVLLPAMLQPVVPAQAALDDASVICTVHAQETAGGNGAPGDRHDCPCCVFGHPCGGLSLLAKALSAHFPAFGLPVSHLPARIEPRMLHMDQRPAAGPPGIRAPPFP